MDHSLFPEVYLNQTSGDVNQTSGTVNQSCSTAFEYHEFTIVAIVNMVVGLLSFIICCFTILLIAVLKKWQFFSQRLILYLTITALLSSLANTINRVDFTEDPSDGSIGFCVFSGFLTQVTSWMILCSISSITFYLFMRVIVRKNTEKLEWVYVVYTFAFPFLFNWIPFINTSYGRAGVWCWIRSFDLRTCEVLVFGKWLQFSLLYIPLYCILAVLITLYVIIIVKIYRKRKVLTGIDNPHAKKVMRKVVNEIASLMAYPMIYFVLSLPLLVNRIYSSAYPMEPSLTLWYLAAITFPLQGACTGVIFTFNTVFCRRMTWVELRSRTSPMSRTETTQHKVTEYPMKTDEVSDSVAFTARTQHNSIDYVEYQP